MTERPVAAAGGDLATTVHQLAERAAADGLAAAQAGGDRQALAERGRPLLHLHLTDLAAGLGQLLEALP